MMMTDLRGFTSLSEREDPERVVAMLNSYLDSMIQIIEEYRGTIDEFIGDAIFVLFGAPLQQDDDAQRAVACALAMQLAMSSVNERNGKDNLPPLEMGIGIHTGQVVVGNIGSAKRMKYGVVGRDVESRRAHPVLHDGWTDTHLRCDSAGSGRNPQDRQTARIQSEGN